MPYKSKAQMRKFYAMEAEGKLPEGTAQEWADHTPNIKKLPERVKKKAEQIAGLFLLLDKAAEAMPISGHITREDASRAIVKIATEKSALFSKKKAPPQKKSILGKLVGLPMKHPKLSLLGAGTGFGYWLGRKNQGVGQDYYSAGQQYYY